ncbi:MAG: 2,3-bisphosphoglycerate-independent phosphoglycerate mutase [Bacteroidetes bacterium]|nr:2,3-bisphosphoglycerate-independent phosphoglycerate mutase [Bacteroidota bacterium]
MVHKKAALFILDGWGIGKGDNTDAIASANTPVMDKLMKEEPHTTLKTFGENVGLPEGQMGNSEVGHLNIGAGRIVYQMLVKINLAFRNRSVLELEGFKTFLDACAHANRKIHLIGLVSNGGVHSSEEHLLELCSILKEIGYDNRTFIHAFMDGRDCDPHSGKGFLEKLLSDQRLGSCKVASITGRYYAMDRDKRWERVKLAYDALVNSTGKPIADPIAGMQESYDEGITDEFVKPMIVTDSAGQPIAAISENDVVLCFNFRTDRGREITTALTQQAFHEQNMHPLKLHYFTMTEYDKKYKNVGIIFHNDDLKMTMGEYVSSLGLKQLRAAETEKYPHVTFFFSGGRESEFDGEERILIPSPKVATYDLQPEMSAPLLKEAVLAAIRQETYDFLCVNFANPDMVGHTGVFEAIKKAVETVDSAVGELKEACDKHGYKMMIIADHGNADLAVNPDGTPNTAHSVNLVPCILPGQDVDLHPGVLADVAPTLLKMMELPQPSEMTGKPLY